MDHKKERQLTWLLSLPVLGILVFLGFVPLAWPILSRYEGELFPVVRNVEVEYLGDADVGIYVNARFDKVRACEFIGISWYDSFGDRSPILFEANAAGQQGEIPRTRPAMDGQTAGPWKLIGIDTLDGSIAITSHRCHPLWITYTRFYP